MINYIEKIWCKNHFHPEIASKLHEETASKKLIYTLK